MSITRADIERRSREIWPNAGVPYSQGTLHPSDGYRQDCSGYVSLCWAIPHSTPGSWGGLSTVTLVTRGHMREIPRSDLQVGDALGRCGPGTAGNGGHVMLFVRWAGNGQLVIREQAGGGPGWRERTIAWPASYRAYRFAGLDGGMPAAGLVPSYELPVHALGSRLLQQGAYGTDVRELQVLLNRHGAIPALVADGEFGPATEGEVRRFQAQAQIEVDGVVGPVTLAALPAAPVLHRPWPPYVPVDEYFGHVDGPDQSHGGHHTHERPDVQAIQQRLADLGYGALLGPSGVDGWFGDATEAAAEKWQRDRSAAPTRFGQVRPDDWRALFTY